MTEPTEPIGEMFKQAAQLRIEAARIAAQQVSDQASQAEKDAEAKRLEDIENERLRMESSELAKAFITLMSNNDVPKTAYVGATAGYDPIRGHGWILRDYIRGRNGPYSDDYIPESMGLIILDDGSLHSWAKVGEVLVGGEKSWGRIMTEDDHWRAMNLRNRSDPPNQAYLATRQGKALLSDYISKSGVPIPGDKNSSVSLDDTETTKTTSG